MPEPEGFIQQGGKQVVRCVEYLAEQPFMHQLADQARAHLEARTDVEPGTEACPTCGQPAPIASEPEVVQVEA